jgi:hypothetical protein
MSPNRTQTRPRRSLHTPPRPRGLHPAGALARPHRKNHDATTPVLTNLWESDHTLTQRLGGYCRYQQYGGTTAIAKTLTKTETSRKDSPLDGAPRPRPGSDSYEARSTGCLDRAPAPTRTRPARRGASTASRLRLVRGPLDGAPRPRSGSDSYEARSTGRLDRAPAPRRPFFTYPGQKP